MTTEAEPHPGEDYNDLIIEDLEKSNSLELISPRDTPEKLKGNLKHPHPPVNQRKLRGAPHYWRDELAKRGWKKLQDHVETRIFVQTIEEDRLNKIYRGDSSKEQKRKRSHVPCWISHSLWVWSLVISLNLSVSIILSAIKLVYKVAATSSFVEKQGYISDSIFIADLLIEMLQPRLVKDILVVNPFSLSKTYLTKGKGIPFLFNIILLCPWNKIHDFLYVIPVLRIVYFNKIVTPIHSIVSTSLLSFRIPGSHMVDNILRETLSVFFMLIFTGHLFAVGWLYSIEIGLSEVDLDASIERESSGTESDILKVLSDLLVGEYYIFSTLTTVGYGDYLPDQLFSMIFVMFLELVGISIYGYIMGIITYTLFGAGDETKDGKKEQRNKADLWIVEREKEMVLSFERIHFLDLMMNSIITIDQLSTFDIGDSEFYQGLPPNIKSQLLIQTLSGIRRRFHSLFHGLSVEFSNTIILNLVPVLSYPGETILQKGLMSDGVYLILRGKIVLVGEHNLPMRKLKTGLYFGDFCLLKQASKMNFTVDAGPEQKNPLLYRIKEEILDEMAKIYPKDIQVLVERASMRQKVFQFFNQETQKNISFLQNIFSPEKSIGKGIGGPGVRRSQLALGNIQEEGQNAQGKLAKVVGKLFLDFQTDKLLLKEEKKEKEKEEPPEEESFLDHSFECSPFYFDEELKENSSFERFSWSISMLTENFKKNIRRLERLSNIFNNELGYFLILVSGAVENETDEEEKEKEDDLEKDQKNETFVEERKEEKKVGENGEAKEDEEGEKNRIKTKLSLKNLKKGSSSFNVGGSNPGSINSAIARKNSKRTKFFKT